MKNQRKLVSVEEVTPSEKKTGHVRIRNLFLTGRPAVSYCPWFLTKPLCILLWYQLCISSSYPLLPYTHTPPLSWGGLSWFLFPDQAAVTPLWLWDAFVFTQGSGDGGDPSLQHPFCSDLDLPHQLSPLVISSKQFHSFPKSLFWNSPSVPEV